MLTIHVAIKLILFMLFKRYVKHFNSTRFYSIQINNSICLLVGNLSITGTIPENNQYIFYFTMVLFILVYIFIRSPRYFYNISYFFLFFYGYLNINSIISILTFVFDGKIIVFKYLIFKYIDSSLLLNLLACINLFIFIFISLIFIYYTIIKNKTIKHYVVIRLQFIKNVDYNTKQYDLIDSFICSLLSILKLIFLIIFSRILVLLFISSIDKLNINITCEHSYYIFICFFLFNSLIYLFLYNIKYFFYLSALILFIFSYLNFEITEIIILNLFDGRIIVFKYLIFKYIDSYLFLFVLHLVSIFIFIFISLVLTYYEIIKNKTSKLFKFINYFKYREPTYYAVCQHKLILHLKYTLLLVFGLIFLFLCSKIFLYLFILGITKFIKFRTSLLFIDFIKFIFFFLLFISFLIRIILFFYIHRFSKFLFIIFIIFILFHLFFIIPILYGLIL